MTVFESVLERLKAEMATEEQEDEAGSSTSRGGITGLPSGFAGLKDGHVFAPGWQAAAAYRDLYEDMPPAEIEEAPVKPPSPPHLLRIAPEEIADDLALKGTETLDELAALRRAFARENHPDLVDPDLRDNATLRMKIANMLIDETLRRINVESSFGIKR
ncbi:hypothetical protein [Sinorhizobium sp. BG8]|uniref:hypothetical protein n=1 Tax=Sinorhizobium sp. BG8 TaxID=2613773 RepID=UPI00193E6FB2|nr:hypothetical protein [Sinorhizobium sp. BG8]QRM56390.1 hypothetical protein F3Y30_18990 [Sinorhizobium sp. BG8]